MMVRLGVSRSTIGPAKDKRDQGSDRAAEEAERKVVGADAELAPACRGCAGSQFPMTTACMKNTAMISRGGVAIRRKAPVTASLPRPRSATPAPAFARPSSPVMRRLTTSRRQQHGKTEPEPPTSATVPISGGMSERADRGEKLERADIDRRLPVAAVGDGGDRQRKGDGDAEPGRGEPGDRDDEIDATDEDRDAGQGDQRADPRQQHRAEADGQPVAEETRRPPWPRRRRTGRCRRPPSTGRRRRGGRWRSTGGSPSRWRSCRRRRSRRRACRARAA